MINQKSKKLKPSSKLKLWVKESREAGIRVEHLLFGLIEGIETACPENHDWVGRNIGLKGLSSLVDWERTQALEELFLCARGEEELGSCESCELLRPIDNMDQDDDLDGHYCPKCLDDIISEKETDDENFRTYFRGWA